MAEGEVGVHVKEGAREGAPNKFTAVSYRGRVVGDLSFRCQTLQVPLKRGEDSYLSEPRVISECHCGPGDPGDERVGVRWERAAVVPAERRSASVATGALSTSPPAQRRQAKWKGRETDGFQQRCRAPKREPLRRVYEGRAVQARGGRSGWGRRSGRAEGVAGGARAGGNAGGGQVPGLEPPGQTRSGRALAGSRGYECAVRARRGECVCPRFPLPSPPVLRPDGAASGRQSPAAPSGSTAGRSLAAARSGTGNREPGTERSSSGAPRARARVPAWCAPESERGAERAGCAVAAAAGEAAGPARRPPRLFPFSLHPLAPSPQALQRSQTGLQHPERQRPELQPQWAGRPSRCVGTGRLSRRRWPRLRARLGWAPGIGRCLQDSRASPGVPGRSQRLEALRNRAVGIGRPLSPGHRTQLRLVAHLLDSA
nr:translation initiation factor IF-2-like [Pongo pygmaeus]